MPRSETRDTAWACYYSDFPIVRITDEALTGWHNQTRGATALIVAENACALIGGYGTDRDLLTIGSLSAGQYDPVGQARLTLPDGAPLSAGTLFAGRGPDLHLLAGTAWYRLALDDVI